MIDTHCHLTFPEFRGKASEILDEAAAHGVRGAITVATTIDDAERGLELARSDPRIRSTAGVHPLYSDRPAAEIRDWERLRRCGLDPRCVAWGELGLDRHYKTPSQEAQRSVLDEQLAAIARWRAEGLAKPVVIHCREAFDELLPILAASGLPRDRFVFHCFTAGPREARLVLDFGAWISFTGVVTFRNATEVAEAARLVPEDRLMAETDSPFLTPEPHRTVRPNRPRFVADVIRRLAELRGTGAAALGDRLDENAERFFGFRPPA
jgi:TatD DNase family protein